MAGSDTKDASGVYGEKGVSDPSNVPGRRSGAVGWYDSLHQELWLFGGQAFYTEFLYSITLMSHKSYLISIIFFIEMRSKN